MTEFPAFKDLHKGIENPNAAIRVSRNIERDSQMTKQVHAERPEKHIVAIPACGLFTFGTIQEN